MAQERPSGRAADENTLYSVCSISKLFTAIAIMQLRDEGKLTLRDNVALPLRENLSVSRQLHERLAKVDVISAATRSRSSWDRSGPTRSRNNGSNQPPRPHAIPKLRVN